MIDRRVSALIMMPDGNDRDFLRADRTFGTPIVLAGRPAHDLAADVVNHQRRRGRKHPSAPSPCPAP
jgi:DNA-binding LacI/PurR family transcriptional regulator